MRVVLFVGLFILVIRVALHKDAFESFVFAVALAVGLTASPVRMNPLEAAV
jgi:hypothetical protein